MRNGFVALDVSFLKMAVAIAILITALIMQFQKQLHGFGRHLRLSDAKHFKKWQLFLIVIAGTNLGGLVTVTSIGAGAVAMLTYLYSLSLTPARLVATDIVHVIPSPLFAGMGHLFIAILTLVC